MSALATRRWSEDGVTWFAVRDVGSEFAEAASRVFMGYERAGSEWRRGYPADTPHLELAWQNFAWHIEAVLRQAAGLDPVPWLDALREVCRRTTGQPVAWWLTGSAALAVRGAPIEPGDLDLVCGSQDAAVLGDLFSDALLEPVLPAGPNWISDSWGRAFCGARIEWIGGPRPSADHPLPSDFGLAAASRLQTLSFEGWPVRVPPLELQRAVCRRRGLTDRVALIDVLADYGPTADF